MVKGMVADIQRASIHDGPGLRTTVFLKGCPLRCLWCHNPECISFNRETLYYPDKCIHCGRCEEGCFAGARVVCGAEMTPEEVMQQLLLDRDYYQNGGGVTLSGGEPMAQPEFAFALLDLLKNENIHTAAETSLYLYSDEVMKKLDLLMADLKIWDDETHKAYTGVSNKTIKENFIRADELGVPIIVRTPVVPGIEQGIPDISEFAKGLKHSVKYELLPYHPLGVTKQIALGEKPMRFDIPSREKMKELSKYAYIR